MKKLFLALLLLAKICMGQQTADSVGLIGTIVSPTGVPLNGQLTLALNMANVKNVCTTPYQTAPRGPITFTVTNGVIVNGATANLLSNDCMEPRSSYYVTMYDTYHKVLFAVNWYLRQQPITSSHRTQDVGTIARQYLPPPGATKYNNNNPPPNPPMPPPTIPPTPPPPNNCVVAAWPMNEGSGLVFHDTISPTDNMTLSGSGVVTWQTNTGLPGTTPYFNGNGYAIGSSAAKTNFDGTKPFSVAFWTNNLSNSMAAINSQLIGSANYLSSPPTGWQIYENGNTTLGFIPNYVADGAIVFDLTSTSVTGNGIQAYGAFSTINNGQLYYVVVTYDGSMKASGVKFYKNGGMGGTSVVINYDTLTGSAAYAVPVQVGEAPGGGIPFTGALAFVEIWGCVLTPAQVQTYFLAGPQIN